MIVDAVENLSGCKDCGFVGWVEIAGRKRSCGCVEERRQRMIQYQPLLNECSMDIYSGMTFEAFEPQNESQRLAFHTMSTMFSGYYLFGPYGVGKTHLAASMCHALLDKNVPAVIVTTQHALRLMNPKGKAADVLMAQLLRVRYLVIDDLGTENPTQWTQAKLYEPINLRDRLASGYKTKGDTTFTSQIPGDKLEDRYNGQLVDRITGMAMQMVVKGKSMRQRQGRVKYHEEVEA